MLPLILAAFLATGADACPQFFAEGLAPATPAAVQICFDGYSLGHSAVDREPLWSAEHLTAAGVAAALAAKRAGAFHAEPLLPKAARAELGDYHCAPSIDRGHMTPVGDFGVESEENDTFTLANMVPQNATLNEGLWAGLEGAVRQLAAQEGELYVVTGPVIGCEMDPTTPGACQPALLNRRVSIPSATWKAVYDPKARTAFVYVAANNDAGGYFVETVAALIQQIGFDPLPGVPADVKSPATTPIAPPPLKGNASLKPRVCH